MISKTCLPAANDIISESTASGNTGLSNHHTSLAKLVVMSDLNQIINPAAVTDNRIIQSTAVNTSISADFNIITDNHPSHLRNTLVLTVYHLKTKPILSDSRTGINITIIPHNRISNGSICTDTAIIAYLAAVSNNNPCFNLAMAADSDLFTDNRIFADKCIFTDNRRRVNFCCGSNISPRRFFRIHRLH